MISFLLKHCAAGILVGWGILALLLFTDTANMGTLMTGAGPSGSDIAWIPLGLLAFGFMITFGSMAMGTAVFMIPSKEDEDPRGPRPNAIADVFAPPLEAAKIRVRAEEHRRF